MTEEKLNVYEGPYHWFLPWFYEQKYLEPLRQISPLLKGKSVLDVGCGDGRLTCEMARNAKQVHGMDNQQIAIDFANLMSRGVKNVSYSIQLPKKKYDVVTSFDVIEHIPIEEVQPFLEGLNERLKKGGKLIITTPNREELRARIFGHRLNEKHYQEFTKEELVQTIEEAGFAVESVKGVYVPPPIPHIEHFASVIPFRYIFKWLIKFGNNRPSIAVGLVVAATKKR